MSNQDIPADPGWLIYVAGQTGPQLFRAEVVAWRRDHRGVWQPVGCDGRARLAAVRHERNECYLIPGHTDCWLKASAVDLADTLRWLADMRFLELGMMVR